MVDIVGYRKHGHNEIDEPMFTQPIMYSVVRKHKDVMQLYSKKLQDEGNSFIYMITIIAPSALTKITDVHSPNII